MTCTCGRDEYSRSGSMMLRMRDGLGLGGDFNFRFSDDKGRRKALERKSLNTEETPKSVISLPQTKGEAS